jgi:RNA polymerase sigma factor (TIGR02999 family)
MTDVTRILNAIERGEDKATEELLPLVYEELRLLAAKKLSQEQTGHTLQATALVHEAYLRLVGDDSAGWDNRGHFFVAAAEAMRRILVEHARRKKSRKRGGGRARVRLDELTLSITGPSDDIVAVNEALDKLAAREPDVANIVKLHYFSGLTLDQVAELQGIGRRTAVKYLAYARAWLHREISATDASHPPSVSGEG